MSFAYFPIYTGDYLRDTRHLTPLRHGVYLLLLMHCWDTQGPAPLDEQELCGIANCRSADEVEALRYVLARYFVNMVDGHYNERVQKEIERCNAISETRSEAGRRGANERMRKARENKRLDDKANAKQMSSKSLASDANLIPIPSPALSPSPTKPAPGVKERSGEGTPRATRLTGEWRLPESWKVWAVEAHGLTPQQAVTISLSFRDYWIAVPGAKGCKLDWQATWRNWVRKECERA